MTLNNSMEDLLYRKLTAYATGENVSSSMSIQDDATLALQTMRATQRNEAHRVIMSHRPVIGSLIVFAKKLVRRCLKWYINPICDQQSVFNDAVCTEMEELHDTVQQLSSGLSDMQNDSVNHWADFRSEVESEIDARTKVVRIEAQKTIASLQAELEDLRKVSSTMYQQMKTLQEFSLLKEREDCKHVSFSQSGEDMIAAYIFNVLGIDSRTIRYLDLGANHARELSNTYFFYSCGARGVLLEANPRLIPELQQYRPEDEILHRCLTNRSGETVPFYVLSGDGLSTADPDSVARIQNENPNIQLEKTVDVKGITMTEIIEQFFPEAPELVNIDLEGMEEIVLHAINFESWRPLILIVESIPYRSQLVIDEKRFDLLSFMKDQGYSEYAFTGINSIFLDTKRFDGGR